MIKNAIECYTRKKNRTLIIFNNFTIVLSCLYSLVFLFNNNDEIEKARKGFI
ncbi:hypothetical protein EfmGK923_28070 (plasmid) [Enterococcus faecium]|nr:hypothetical protein EfmGK923_28070 [Enterococcus faecium]